MTKKELELIDRQLDLEAKLAREYSSYARQMKNPTLRAKCEQIAGAHVNHFQLLYAMLQKEGKRE